MRNCLICRCHRRQWAVFSCQLIQNMNTAVLTLGLFFLLGPHEIHQLIVPGNLPHPVHMAIGAALVIAALSL